MTDTFTAEIVNDELAETLTRLAGAPQVRTVLEVGSGDGQGSTMALLRGLQGKLDSRIACLETRGERFQKLIGTLSAWRGMPVTVSDEAVFAHIDPTFSQGQGPGPLSMWSYRRSSVPVERWLTRDEVRSFFRQTRAHLDNYQLDTVLDWLREERKFALQVEQGGIEAVKRDWAAADFDLVLLDGCPFCGEADLEAVYGSRIIVLDDINDIKNFWPFQSLSWSADYEREEMNYELRNGYAVFRKR